MVLQPLFLCIKVNVNVFSVYVMGFLDSVQYLSECNISQNIACLHHIDLYDNIF